MKIQLETLKDSEVKLIVELAENELEAHKKEALLALQQEVKMPGFRPGHIPAEALERHVGEQALWTRVMDIAISHSYEEAVHEQKLRPIDYPRVNILSEKPLKYEATLPVIPVLEWKKDPKKLSIKREKLEVTEKEIKEVLENLKKRVAKWKDVERLAQKGDRVELDFDGFDLEGKALEGTSSKNHPVILGEGGLIPGFEEEVIGMKKDEEKDFEITFPKDYHAEEFKSKKVKFHIKLNRIEEPEEHELNDEFAKEITGGNRQNMEELRKEIQEELMKQKDREEVNRLEAAFLKELPAYAKVEVPNVLVEREIDFMVNRMKEDMNKRRLKWDDYVKEVESQGKNIREELRKTAHEQVIVRLGLEKLYEEEKVEISEKEVDDEVARLLAFYPAHFAAAVEQRYKNAQEREYLKNQLSLRKLVMSHVE